MWFPLSRDSSHKAKQPLLLSEVEGIDELNTSREQPEGYRYGHCVDHIQVLQTRPNVAYRPLEVNQT